MNNARAALLPLTPDNQVLSGRVRPEVWLNPRPASRYNLVVIGAGTAGLVAAVGAAALGAKVALVERELLGGDCLNVGCVPSKALIRCARAAAEARAAASFGVRGAEAASIDFPAVMERMRRLRARIAEHDSAQRLRDLGVDVFFGEARFAGRDVVRVGDAALRFARACIATGARPIVPEVPGLEDAGYRTNVTLFSLTELPRRLAVVGGGPLGCEMAQAFARFGAHVVIVEAGEGILGREDRDAAERVAAAMRQDGVEIVTEAKIERVERRQSGKALHLSVGGGPREVEVDEILIGAGRAPNVDRLDLEAAGVRHDRERGVHVDDRLRTTNRRVYAAGDVCSAYKFTHTADAFARIVVRNALFFGRCRTSDLTVPWCTYTSPEVAHVGLYEREARERGLDVATYRVELADVDRAVLDGEEAGFLVVHALRRSGRILGATLVAEHAGETIAEIVLAMRARATLRTLAGTIHPYPTQAEALRKAGDAHLKSKLTPFVHKCARRFLAWRR